MLRTTLRLCMVAMTITALCSAGTLAATDQSVSTIDAGGQDAGTGDVSLACSGGDGDGSDDDDDDDGGGGGSGDIGYKNAYYC